MSGLNEDGPRAIGWIDLTVADAPKVRDFYAAVAGWDVETVEMDGYDDFVMVDPGTGAPVAGVCHARGPNSDLPPQWMIYVSVADIDASVARCIEHGGRVRKAPTVMGEMGRYCVIEDPAGAVAALFEAADAALDDDAS